MAADRNIEDLDLLEIHKKNLARLNLQKAKHGSLNVSLHILNQIDDEEKEIQRIERLLTSTEQEEKEMPKNEEGKVNQNKIGRASCRERV